MLITASDTNRCLHYGWVIVAVGALVLFSCLGLARYAYTMLLPAMQAGLRLGNTGLTAAIVLYGLPWFCRRYPAGCPVCPLSPLTGTT